MRPRPRLFRPHLAGLACVTVLAGCQPAQPPPAAAPEPNASPPAAAAPPPAPPALDRARLLRALDLAASSSASGRAAVEDDDVVGRRFVVRQAFGCQGPAAGPTPGVAQWTWARDRRAIEITLTPADWSRDEIFSGADMPWEAVEGFWITRPWMQDEACPARPADAERAADNLSAGGAPEPGAAPPAAKRGATPQPAATAPQVAGLASVFEAGGSRVGRRDGKAFAFTLRAGEDEALAMPTRGFRLVIEGRLKSYPAGRAVRCRAASADDRPVCMAAAEVDRVAFEDADGKLLREWRPG